MDAFFIAIRVPDNLARKNAGFQGICRIGRGLPGEEEAVRFWGDGKSTVHSLTPPRGGCLQNGCLLADLISLLIGMAQVIG